MWAGKQQLMCTSLESLGHTWWLCMQVWGRTPVHMLGRDKCPFRLCSLGMLNPNMHLLISMIGKSRYWLCSPPRKLHSIHVEPCLHIYAHVHITVLYFETHDRHFVERAFMAGRPGPMITWDVQGRNEFDDLLETFGLSKVMRIGAWISRILRNCCCPFNKIHGPLTAAELAEQEFFWIKREQKDGISNTKLYRGSRTT